MRQELLTWVDLLDCRACLERAFLWDSDSSSRTGVRYDLTHTNTQLIQQKDSFPSPLSHFYMTHDISVQIKVTTAPSSDEENCAKKLAQLV